MIFNTAVQRSFEYNNIPLRRSFEKIFYEYMNKLPGKKQNPPPPLPSREGGEWGVGSAPHSLGGKVKVFIPQGKACPIFLSMLPNKTFLQRLFKKTFHLSHQ